MKSTPQLERALATLDRMMTGGETITREAIVKEAGVGEGTAQKAMALRRSAMASIREHSAALGLPHYFERLKEVEDLLNSPRWAVMPSEHFRVILACLHPDNAREGHEKRFEEAFALFNGYKLKMVDLSQEKDEKDRRKRIEARGASLPGTVEEMLARRKVKR